MLRPLALCVALSLGAAHAQQNSPTRPAGNSTPAYERAEEALNGILDALPANLSCERPDVWEVSGDARAASRTLNEKLTERGWPLLGQVPGSRGAVIADPNPFDPVAFGVGGWARNGDGFVAFIAVCRAIPDPTVDLFTHDADPGAPAAHA